MRSISFFDVRGRPGNLHFPILRLPLNWLKQRLIALPSEGSVQLCYTVTVGLCPAHQIKHHTYSRIANAKVVCAKESART